MRFMNKKTALKFCVIGCGNISMKYFIDALMSSENSEVVVCVDHGLAKRKIVQEKYGLPFETSFQDALDCYEFDAVYIATPSGLHKKYAIQAAEHGKHILCEKSLASNFVDAEEMVFAASNNNVAIFEGFMYQFHRQNLYVKKLLDSGRLGEAVLLNACFAFPARPESDFRLNKNKGGGGLLDAGAYTVHLARQVFKSEIKEIDVDVKEFKGVDIQGLINLKFENGGLANLFYSMNSFYKNKYEILLEKGNIRVDRAFSVSPDYKPVLKIESEKSSDELTLEADNHFVNEIDYFVENCRKKKYRKLWYEEITNQALSLDRIFSEMHLH